MQKSIKKLMPSKIDVWSDFGVFCSENGGMFASTSHQNLSSQKMWKIAFGASPLVPNWVRGVEVGSKIRTKIDQKMRSTWEGILASIFDGFWWILGGKLGGKIEPRGIKNGIEKTMKKWRATRWPKSRNKTSERRLSPRVLVPGEVPPFKAGQSSGADAARPLASKVL